MPGLDPGARLLNSCEQVKVSTLPLQRILHLNWVSYTRLMVN